MTFDYSASDTPDDAVRAIAAEMSGSGLRPLSDEEKQQRELWREQQAWQTELARIEQEQHRAEVEAAQRQEAAAEIAERNRQRRLQQQREYQERAEQRSRNLDLSALKFEPQQSAAWRNAVQHDLRRQHVTSLYGELEKMLTAPVPPAPTEPDVVYVEQSAEKTELDYPKLHRWFDR